jgi:hypothetical protein
MLTYLKTGVAKIVVIWFLYNDKGEDQGTRIDVEKNLTQMYNYTNLQYAILFLPGVERGKKHANFPQISSLVNCS